MPTPLSVSLTVHVARPGEAGLVLELFDQAARWLLHRGIHQWPYPAPKGYRDLIRRETVAGRVFLAARPGDPEAVATFRLEWTPNAL